jgi:drug/metabolite transporter (DMT)-like permease
MKTISYFYLIVATIIWAFAPAIVKYALNDIDPMYFLFIRFFIVSILCLPYLFIILKTNKYSSYDYKNLILFSFSGQVSLILYFKGLDLTTSTDTIILSLIGPLLTIAAGHYFYKEKLNFFKELGIFLSFIGAILVVIEPLLSQTNGLAKDRFTGNLLVLSATLIGTFWVIYAKFLFGKNSTKFISFVKKFGFKLHKKTYNDVDFNILSFYITFFIMVPFYILNFDSYNQTTLNLSPTSLAVILYMAIFSSIIAYILYIKAQAVLEVTEVSIIGYISPIFSLPASYLVLKEIPTLTALVGLSVIFLGIAVAEYRKKAK